VLADEELKARIAKASEGKGKRREKKWECFSSLQSQPPLSSPSLSFFSLRASPSRAAAAVFLFSFYKTGSRSK